MQETHRLRFIVDVVVKGPKPPGAIMSRIANRGGTLLRNVAVEGLEDRFTVIHDESVKNQSAHTHDATEGRCRACVEASGDELGPID